MISWTKNIHIWIYLFIVPINLNKNTIKYWILFHCENSFMFCLVISTEQSSENSKYFKCQKTLSFQIGQFQYLQKNQQCIHFLSINCHCFLLDKQELLSEWDNCIFGYMRTDLCVQAQVKAKMVNVNFKSTKPLISHHLCTKLNNS